ncbi:PhzF family phenazine biosynthesis protein [Sedimentibacter acidaminivorans]|nr:PhzF family phenazine biosynthesis protein [Sedimentibacter acidaminivorans]
MKFYIVDAFTDVLFGGNPAGVVIIDEGSDFPDDKIMRKTAAELRYSETAFIKQIGEKDFNIRYFTPASEVDLCGHATIGSFCALADLGLVECGCSYINSTKAGRLNIEVLKNSILMDMGLPENINKISDSKDLDELYSIMGLSYEKQGEILTGEKLDFNLLPEMISTGLPDIMMPVKNEGELAKINPEFEALSKLSEKYKVVGVHAFTVNTKDGAVHCRNFAPLYDIDEEAATGTSNGALTFYLYKNGLLNEGTDNIFIQGEAMNRPSRIMSKLSFIDGNVKIQVGGMASILACGEIRL